MQVRRIVGVAVVAAMMAACSPATEPVDAPVEPSAADSGPAAAPEPQTPELVPSTPEPEASAPVAPVVAAPEAPAPQTNAQPSATPAAPTQGRSMLDQRLVGKWVNENQINSPGGAGGFASFSTVMTMEVHADGTIRQYTQSVGGGGDWSSNSGVKLDFEGQWRADGTTLSVLGMGLPDYTPAATYTFSGNYLVTNNNQGRLIWQRR